MDKKFITVEKDDGTTEEMEVILTFTLSSTNKNYMIYKRQTNDEYFVVSVDNDNATMNFNTDFTEQEKSDIQKIFDQLVKGGKVDA